MICIYLIHFININSYLLYSVIIVYLFVLANLYSTYLLCILRDKKYLKKLSVVKKLFAISVTWGYDKNRLVNTPLSVDKCTGKEEKIALPLVCKKRKKREGNGPLINDSNCSKLIEYIIHRHPLLPTTCCHIHQFHGKRHAIWLPSLSTCLLSSTAFNSIYETQGSL